MNKDIVKYLPKEYFESLEKVFNLLYDTFKDDLKCITLGGSGGKNEIIEGSSDLDLYVILENINILKVSKILKEIENYKIHIGITYYSEKEVLTKNIDNKTKIMIYEKQNFKVNPNIYGFIDYPVINYDEVIINDIDNLPNVKHTLMRECALGLINKDRIDKKYIKKLFVLIKCYLNTKGIFSYGYQTSLNKFLSLVNKETLNNFKLDIENILKNIDSNKDTILDFSQKVLVYVDEEFKNRRIV